jgi:4-alpha-glucanotransferase
MKVQFYLRFYSHSGQNLFISGNSDRLGNHEPEKAIPLQYLNDQFWHGSLELEDATPDKIQYSYFLKNADNSIVMEWGDDRIIDISKSGIEEIQLIDTWNHAGEFENAFFTAPFQQTLLKHARKGIKPKEIKPYTHVFKVKAPLLKKDEILCICGSGKALKDWDTDSPVLMSLEGNWWTCNIALPKESFPVSYKYGVYEIKRKTLLHFENGDNRILYGDATKKKICISHDGFAHLPNNTWRGTGIAIPVFSLRSKYSFGVGEFTDLTLLVDWAKKTGIRLIQLLPVNDTIATNTYLDSYPYASISAFALHPIYLNLTKVAGKKHASLIKPLLKKQKELNELAEVDYEEVMKIKIPVIRELYKVMKDNFLEDKEFQQFFEQNKHWLVPYAAFCNLRDRNGTSDFTKWKTHSKFDKLSVQKHVSPKARHYDTIAVYYFAQFHLHLQLMEAAAYAHEHGIIMKGDIPIGIYRHSCDAWIEPELYHMDAQAGAPPDGFAVKGQNWGFPTYNWAQMAKDNFSWWKKRFEQMSNYFDAFRIDHILGFFRIWSIPMQSLEGVMGHFVEAVPVHINEFSERNIPFNYQRYVKPFINDAILWEYFGNDSEDIKSGFLHPLKDGLYELHDTFHSQKAVEEYFAALEINDYNSKLKSGLFNLISNIILFEAEGSLGQQFHFRISMENTPSFRYLHWDTQQQLKDLYINYFFQRQDNFWKEEAMKKLPSLKRSTNMLVCGEDLGMVPHCVPDVMKQLGLLSLEIQRMPKDPKKEFFHPTDAPYLSVVTPSTHDMSTIRGWWEEDRAKTQRFYNYELGQWGEAPFFCEAWINKAIVIQHLYSPAMWSIFQLQDLLGIDENVRRENPHDERINNPADPKNYWRYRLHLTLEELIKQKSFNEELKTQIMASGRV